MLKPSWFPSECSPLAAPVGRSGPGIAPALSEPTGPDDIRGAGADPVSKSPPNSLEALALQLSDRGLILDAGTLLVLAGDIAVGHGPELDALEPWMSPRKLSRAEVASLMRVMSDEAAEAVERRGIIASPAYAAAAIDDTACLRDRLACGDGEAVRAFRKSVPRQAPPDLERIVLTWDYALACLGDREAMSRLSVAQAKAAKSGRALSDRARGRLSAVSQAWSRLSVATRKWSQAPLEDASDIIRQNAFSLTALDAAAHELELELPAGQADTDVAHVGTGPALRPLEAIGDPQSADGQLARKRFGLLLGPLPLRGGGNGGNAVWRALQAQFPWMADANRAIAGAAEIGERGRIGYFRLPRPMLLVGPPGGGKTRWARCVADVLGLAFSPLPLSGSASSVALTGAERGWGTATASFPARAMCDHRTANPLVFLDEIDKTSESRQNGSAIDALLMLTERESAARYHDNYLLGRLDLSRMPFVMAANSVAGLPAALLDRVDIVQVPRPEACHFGILLTSIINDIQAEAEMPDDAMPDLAACAPALERTFLEGRSVRNLKAAVEKAFRDAVWTPPGPRAVA